MNTLRNASTLCEIDDLAYRIAKDYGEKQDGLWVVNHEIQDHDRAESGYYAGEEYKLAVSAMQHWMLRHAVFGEGWGQGRATGSQGFLRTPDGLYLVRTDADPWEYVNQYVPYGARQASERSTMRAYGRLHVLDLLLRSERQAG